MALTMQDLSEGVLVNMANLTLARRDSYLEFLQIGIKEDTVTALRTAPLHPHSLFPAQLLVRAELDVSKSEERRSSHTESLVIFTLMLLQVASHLTNRPGSPVYQLGSR